MLRSAPLLRRGALLIRGPWMEGSLLCGAPPRGAARRPGHEIAQFAVGGGGIAAAGCAAACGARPTITVSRPCPHNRLAAFLASSSVTASTSALRFSVESIGIL